MIPHGTQNGYGNYNCRCDLCKAAGAEYRRTKSHFSPCPNCGARTMNRYRGAQALCRACRNEQVRGPNGENLVHGTERGYKRGCRCESCKLAGARARRERRWRNPEVRERENQKAREKRAAKRSAAKRSEGAAPK